VVLCGRGADVNFARRPSVYVEIPPVDIWAVNVVGNYVYSLLSQIECLLT
jgi:hypothetical protein